MITLFEFVTLRRDVEHHGLKAGDVGMVIEIYENGKGFEVEFGDAKGYTIGTLTLDREDVEPLKRSQILHVRNRLEHA
jgi:hypothetical protein